MHPKINANAKNANTEPIPNYSRHIGNTKVTITTPVQFTQVPIKIPKYFQTIYI